MRQLPDGNQAAQLYRNSGGHLTDPGAYGMDPISTDRGKCHIREAAFFEKYSFYEIFYDLINGNGLKFENGLLFYIDVTRRLSLT